jgi:hypothetical protein
MIHVISVQAAEGGWSVRADAAENAMMFLSGAKAEQAARFLCAPAEAGLILAT